MSDSTSSFSYGRVVRSPGKAHLSLPLHPPVDHLALAAHHLIAAALLTEAGRRDEALDAIARAATAVARSRAGAP